MTAPIDETIYRRLLRDERVSHGAFRLWHYLRDRANDSGESWPGQLLIVEEMHCDKHSLRRWTGQLVSAGYITTQTFGCNHQLRYILAVPVSAPREHSGGVEKPTADDSRGAGVHPSRCGFSPRRGGEKPTRSKPNEVNPLSNKIPPTPKGEEVKFSIPAALDTPDFREAWAEWVQYRMGYKSKSKRVDLMFAKQLTSLAKDPDSAVEVLHQSIRNGWQGLFQLKPGQSTNNGRRGQPI